MEYATVLEIALSLLLGLVFATSAVPKLRHPRGFVLTVLEYRVLPERFARAYAWLIPPLELVLAISLVLGTATRAMAVLAAMLLASFMVAVGVNLARHRYLECQCFGSAVRRQISGGLLLQDGLLLASAVALVALSRQWVGAEPWSLLNQTPLALGGPAPSLLFCIVAALSCSAVLSRPRRRGQPRRSWSEEHSPTR